MKKIFAECFCNEDGSQSMTCDDKDGKCPCKPNVVGDKCNQCIFGTYDFPDCPGMIYIQYKKFEKSLFHCQHFLSKQILSLACNYCKYLQNVSVMKKDPNLLVAMILETVPANQGLKAKNVMNARMDLIHFQIVTLVKTNTTIIQIANVRFITFHQNIRFKNHVSFHSLSV